jgi:glycosyltransferase involved in cell wall biosynthesis
LVLHMHDHSQVLRDREVVDRHLSRADLVVGCSNFIAGQVRERFPDLAERLVAIPNATAIPDQHHHQTSHREGTEILFVGRLSPEKGVHVLIEAFNRVHAEYPGTRLTLVGPAAAAPWSFIDPKREDPLFNELRGFYHGQDYSAHLRSLLSPDAAKRVRFVSAVPHPDLDGFYDDSDILVLPSIWNEPFGLPVVEAMARCVPVVTTTRGAFPEIVEHGTSGLMVEPGDSDALATALGALIADEGMRMRMGAAAGERAAAKFSWDRYVAEWRAAYAGLTG